MIAYRTTKVQLEALIEAAVPGWLLRATARTTGFRNLGYYEESSSIWSEVKSVYMTLQGGSKCAYCERKLESIDLGKAEQDVEHFRPKGRVRAWGLPKALKSQGITQTTVPGANRGYFLLPYHPFNYSAACKPCNSALKKDHFPISGTYKMTGENPTLLMSEEPLLICPVGDFDDAPEDLIHFYGVSPQPVVAAGHNRKRALVTIEFFRLDDETKRKNLLRERAAVIIALHPQLEKLADGAVGNDQLNAQAIVDGFTASTAPHTNCALSFTTLFANNRIEAQTVFDAAVRLISSGS